MNYNDLTETLPFILGLLTILIGYFYYTNRKKEGLKPQEDKENDNQTIPVEQAQKTSSKLKKLAPLKKKEVKDICTHQWLLSNLKGHSGEILDLDFSSNGKYLGSCAAHLSLSLSEVSALVPPPAHRSQTQSPPRSLDQILNRYPVMWQGLLCLKNDQAAVQMHFVSGNMGIASASLPPLVDNEPSPLRVAQRMRLDQQQLEGVQKKLQLEEEHCILLALPVGKDQMDVLNQSKNLATGFIQYLLSKQAAGIVNVATPGSQQPAYMIHIFPICDFTNQKLYNVAPDLHRIIAGISHLLIVIATV